jgi:hypothetical protein
MEEQLKFNFNRIIFISTSEVFTYLGEPILKWHGNWKEMLLKLDELNCTHVDFRGDTWGLVAGLKTKILSLSEISTVLEDNLCLEGNKKIYRDLAEELKKKGK